MNKNLILPLLLILLAAVPACKNKKGRIFTSLSHNRTGIDFRNWVKESETFNVLDYGYLYNGAGVATGDINNDGLEDIYFASNLTKNRLYLNKGSFRFEDITDKAGVGGPGTWSTGVNMADVNGDGFLDIYVCTSTDGRPEFRKNLLYINNCNNTFTESAAKYGLDDTGYSTHSVFFDYDKDGDLDLLVINHALNAMAVPEAQLKKVQDPAYEHRLYRNDGNHFTDVSKEAGITQNIMNFGLGVAVADFNNDGWPDIYICNDYFEQDYLFINQKNGTFRDELEQFFDHISLSSMGNDAADINNDGFIDLVTLDMLPEDNYNQKLVAGPDNYDKVSILKKTGFYHQTTRNMMQINNHGSYFTEIGQYAGMYSTNWSWCPLLCDFDNNGLKDLYISNGYAKNNTHMDFIKLTVDQVLKKRTGGPVMSRMGLIDQIPATKLKNYIFRNNGDLTFTDVTDIWGDEQPSLSNGSAYADFDNDGDMDMVVNQINDYALVYRNNTSEEKLNNFLKIRLDGAGMNKEGIGAKVSLTCGDKTYTQEFIPSRGYMSSGSHELIFGIGQASVADEVKVVWPDLREQVIKSVKADQTITLHNNEASVAVPEPVNTPDPLLVQLRGKGIIDFKHQENEYNDFRKQILLPRLLSTEGPRLTSGDVNNDGLTDVFIGGAKDSPGKLYIQKHDGSFVYQPDACFEADKQCEDIGVLLFDADQDGDQDLYVVSGGNEFSKDAPELQHRLYINDGKGNFAKGEGRLPKMLTSGSCVRAADIDNDGDLDLFVGGRLVPGAYPVSPRSYILENDGKGNFKDVTANYNPALENPGMVTDARWADFSGDGKPDLVITGEWMGIRLFMNEGKKLTEITDNSGLKGTEGWWNTIISEDMDNDGDKDFVAGNMGLNSQIKASPTEPVTIYAKDWDNNGTMDALMCYYIKGESYPFYSKDDLTEQIPFIKNKYPTYESYTKQKITDMFTPADLKDALVLKAEMFQSAYIENLGSNHFSIHPLPREAQLSTINSILAGDFNGDGIKDLIVTGNFYGTRIKFGESDANHGLLLLGDGKGGFRSESDLVSGMNIRGEVRDAGEVKTAIGRTMFLFVLNNDSAKVYGYTKENARK